MKKKSISARCYSLVAVLILILFALYLVYVEPIVSRFDKTMVYYDINLNNPAEYQEFDKAGTFSILLSALNEAIGYNTEYFEYHDNKKRDSIVYGAMPDLYLAEYVTEKNDDSLERFIRSDTEYCSTLGNYDLYLYSSDLIDRADCCVLAFDRIACCMRIMLITDVEGISPSEEICFILIRQFELSWRQGDGLREP